MTLAASDRELLRLAGHWLRRTFSQVGDWSSMWRTQHSMLICANDLEFHLSRGLEPTRSTMYAVAAGCLILIDDKPDDYPVLKIIDRDRLRELAAQFKEAAA